jgi:hypothetical protein
MVKMTNQQLGKFDPLASHFPVHEMEGENGQS